MTLHTSADALITCAYWDEVVAEDGFLALGRNRYPCSYVIYTDGTYVYAENGTTGNLDFGGSNNKGGIIGTNAAAVIQASLNALTNGGTIFLKGDFEISKDDGLTLSGLQNIRLVGDGMAKLTYTYVATPASPVIRMLQIGGYGAIDPCNNVVIENIIFDMNESAYPNPVRPAAPGLSSIARIISGSSNILFKNVRFLNSPCNGVTPGVCDGVIIKNCVFDNIGEHCIYVTAAKNVWIHNNKFLNWAKWIRGWGVKVADASENIWINGAYMEPNEDGLGYGDALGVGDEPMALTVDGNCKNIVFENIRAVGDVAIIDRSVASVTDSYNVIINKLHASDWNFIKFTDTDFDRYTALINSYFENMYVLYFPVLTTGCTFIDSPNYSTTEGQNDLTITDTTWIRKTVTHNFVVLYIGRGATTSSNIVLDNCRFENWTYQIINATASIDSIIRNCQFSGGASGWDIRADGTRLQVLDNFFAPDITYGTITIYLQAGTNNILTDNYISTGLTTNINPAFTQKIKNNVGYITENSGAATITAAATSIAVNHGCSYTPSALDVSIILTNQPTNDIGDVYVDTFGAAQFTIRCRNVPGAATAIFNWAVRRV